MPTMPTEPQRALIGRDFTVMQRLARGLSFATQHGLPIGKQGGGKRIGHEITNLRPTLRGFSYEVRVFGEDREPTGHIARVEVTLERIEQRAEYERDLELRNAR